MAVGKRNRVIAVIGVFKLIKAALLITLGIAGLAAVPSELALTSGTSPAGWASRPDATRWPTFSASSARSTTTWPASSPSASLCYAAVFLVEGIGLLSRQRWAEWLTVVVTASFIPIEIYEGVEHFGAGKVVALVLNVAILGYLLWRRITESRSLNGRLGYVLGH